MKIKMTISLKGVVRKDDVAKGYVSFCPALKIYAHGSTSEEAMVCMEKTLALYLETCLSRGTLDTVLHAAGFRPVSGYPAAIDIADIEKEYIAIEKLQDQKFEQAFDIEVPIHLVAQAQMALESQHA
ncbi:MAG TPA: hypothetical protein VFQ43_20225 [Nitrososphaera sp.]|nr:hypothetical protein [Nitrososphaera sp.]